MMRKWRREIEWMRWERENRNECVYECHDETLPLFTELREAWMRCWIGFNVHHELIILKKATRWIIFIRIIIRERGRGGRRRMGGKTEKRRSFSSTVVFYRSRMEVNLMNVHVLQISFLSFSHFLWSTWMKYIWPVDDESDDGSTSFLLSIWCNNSDL